MKDKWFCVKFEVFVVAEDIIKATDNARKRVANKGILNEMSAEVIRSDVVKTSVAEIKNVG